MLFRYTEKPPENAIFPPAALRVSAVASRYTENSSFPYVPNVVALTPVDRLLLITFRTQEQGEGYLLTRGRSRVIVTRAAKN